MVRRSTEIHDEIDGWIKQFRLKMLEEQNQFVPYATMLNLLALFGSWILNNPEELTDKQKKVIIDLVQVNNKYEPPYNHFLWKEKYLGYMIPEILTKEIKEPWQTQK